MVVDIKVSILRFRLSQAYRSAWYPDNPLANDWHLSQSISLLAGSHLHGAWVTLYFMLLNYTLFLILQLLKPPNIPAHHSVYVAFDNTSNFLPSTHFISTCMLFLPVLLMRREERNYNNFSGTYVYIYYRDFNFDTSSELKRCSDVLCGCCSGWNQPTKVLDWLSGLEVLLPEVLSKLTDWCWWHFAFKYATEVLLSYLIPPSL